MYATYHARAPRDWYASRDYEGTPKRSASTRHAELGELSRYHADRGADLRLNAVPDVVTASLPMSRGEGTAVETQDDACGVWFAGRLPLSATPSFKSFIVSRIYHVDVHLICMIGHQKFSLCARGRCSIGAANGAWIYSRQWYSFE